MYTLPVSAPPSKYTQSVLKYIPRFFGWEVVKISNRVFELPPGTTKILPASFFENIIRTKAAPLYRNLLRFELKGKSTTNGMEAGLYGVGNKLIRVNLPKPQQITHFSIKESELTEGKPIFGDSGVYYHTQIGEVELKYALVSTRALMDIETFYKYILLYSNWVDAVYIDGNKHAFQLLKSVFKDSTEISANANLTLANGRLYSKSREYESVY